MNDLSKWSNRDLKKEHSNLIDIIINSAKKLEQINDELVNDE